jgi:hypothetical protein
MPTQTEILVVLSGWISFIEKREHQRFTSNRDNSTKASSISAKQDRELPEWLGDGYQGGLPDAPHIYNNIIEVNNGRHVYQWQQLNVLPIPS